MTNVPRRSDLPPHDEVQLEDLPARPTAQTGATADTGGGSSLPSQSPANADDDIIPIEDLTPRENIKGGRKIILGEILPSPE
jgi:hypothetical protein